ncbi:GGDEF domain-containing protein [Bacillus sp. T33-2]|uniref:GGDEF domain-containing protein n=1 Tax=Bacillus sp. T33-2 TaxID=2054168 RepID=UPI000C763B8A|nr:GGDEF domain-containing protein [Bacillus sp. T33-2]PLR95197.1 GGDEF domain-containing protein [Bacillus sp. T33-2]
MQITIGDIAEEATTITPATKCEDVYTIFKDNSSMEGIVVCTNQQPVGLVMKTQFYQKLSTKYGFDLFMKRTIDLVMNRETLVVDYSVPVAEASALAMQRKQDNLYDYVIVTMRDRIHGIVSIKNLLMKLAEVQVSIAKYSNPLTGLPGNFFIEETLQEVLAYEKYSVLYIDIDTFKVFNDTYGFKEGDELIRETANIVSETVLKNSVKSSFVGHIGGDDFIAVIPHYEHEWICKTIITRFDQMVRRFYSDEELRKGYVQAISRRGKLEEFPLVSISIAVIQNKTRSYLSVKHLSKDAAKLKKRCKEIKKSVYLTLDDSLEERYSYMSPNE